MKPVSQPFWSPLSCVRFYEVLTVPPKRHFPSTLLTWSHFTTCSIIQRNLQFEKIFSLPHIHLMTLNMFLCCCTFAQVKHLSIFSTTDGQMDGRRKREWVSENTYLAFWNLSDRSNAVTLNHSESHSKLAHARQEVTHKHTDSHWIWSSGGSWIILQRCFCVHTSKWKIRHYRCSDRLGTSHYWHITQWHNVVVEFVSRSW